MYQGNKRHRNPDIAFLALSVILKLVMLGMGAFPPKVSVPVAFGCHCACPDDATCAVPLTQSLSPR